VRSNQCALLCDDCGLWCHCKCCGVDGAQYNNFQLQVDFNGICPFCLGKSLPYNNCSFLSCSDLNFSLECSDDTSQLTYSLPVPPFSKNSFLKVAYLNCRSLLSSLEEVYLLMQTYSVDIMTLSETWLNETISDLEIQLVCSNDYYSVVRRDRNRQGGGVAIIISKAIPFCLCPGFSEGKVESLCVNLFPGSRWAILLCCIYRSPSDYHSFHNVTVECEKVLKNCCQKLLILGDFNADLTQFNSQQTKFLNSFVRQFDLHELVKSPTRVTATTSSQLDLILTNCPSYFHTTAAIPCNASDHHVVMTHFCVRGFSECLKHNVISVRQYHKIDIEMLDKVLLDDSWSGIFDIADINVCTEAFTLVMQHVMNALVPLRTLRIKRQRIP